MTDSGRAADTVTCAGGVLDHYRHVCLQENPFFLPPEDFLGEQDRDGR
ncbi:hypothetical protein ACRAWB_05320 [Leifsonia poae]